VKLLYSRHTLPEYLLILCPLVFLSTFLLISILVSYFEHRHTHHEASPPQLDPSTAGIQLQDNLSRRQRQFGPTRSALSSVRSAPFTDRLGLDGAGDNDEEIADVADQSTSLLAVAAPDTTATAADPDEDEQATGVQPVTDATTSANNPQVQQPTTAQHATVDQHYIQPNQDVTIVDLWNQGRGLPVFT